MFLAHKIHLAGPIFDRALRTDACSWRKVAWGISYLHDRTWREKAVVLHIPSSAEDSICLRSSALTCSRRLLFRNSDSTPAAFIIGGRSNGGCVNSYGSQSFISGMLEDGGRWALSSSVVLTGAQSAPYRTPSTWTVLYCRFPSGVAPSFSEAFVLRHGVKAPWRII